MRPLLNLPAVLVLLFLASACQKKPSPTETWKRFSPPEGKFTVLLPSDPIKQEPETDTGFEAVTYRILPALSNVAGMAVAYADQPREGNFESDANKVLDKMRDKAITDLNGQLLSEKHIQLRNYPGREMLVSVSGGFTVRQRMYLAGQRVYSLMIIAGSKGLESPEAEAFFGSFDILQ